MTWAKLDDTFHHHPKLMQVNLAATGLFALGLSYAADNLTDGHLPEKWVRGQLTDDDETAAEQLQEAGLWHRVESGFQVHDFDDYNLTRVQVDQLAESRQEAGRRGGLARAQASARPSAKATAQADPKQVLEQTPSSRQRGGTVGGGSRDRVPSSTVTSNDKRSGSSPSVSRSVARARGEEFEEWLGHYREITGRTDIRGSKPARAQFVARRDEGFSVDELKLATVGCHGNDYLREQKHDVPETILRASKVQRYIQLAKEPAKSGSDVSRRVRELQGPAPIESTAVET